MKKNKEIVLDGICLSQGIAWGSSRVLFSQEMQEEERRIKKEEIDQEIARCRNAFAHSKKDLQKLQKGQGLKESAVAQEVLQGHLEVLSDPLLVGQIEEKIRFSHQKTENALLAVMGEYRNRFCQIENSLFQEKAQDVADLSLRVLKNLRFCKKEKKNERAVFLAQEIFPSDVLEEKEAVAFVAETGGYDSHAAILARSRHIPFIAGIDFQFLKSQKIETILVDAAEGKVVLNPSEKTMRLMAEKRKNFEEGKAKREAADQICRTKDGTEIGCYVNIEQEADVDRILRYQISGVGIFRTEFLVVGRKEVPKQGEQRRIYSSLAQKLSPLPLIIRLFDFGADKSNLLAASALDPSPFGCRGIRFLLRHPHLLEEQLSAILEATSFGNVHLLLPFVTEIEEVLEVKNLLAKLRKSMGKKHLLPLGSMIEIPSLALMADQLLKEVDFVSIGSNDLTQFLFARDRNASEVLKIMPPSFSRLLQFILKSAQEAQKPLFLCGELASNPDYLPQLLQMGVRRFSLSLGHLLSFKEKIGALFCEERKRESFDL